jgi:NAD(P)-dependent dehydrogenase (short-subunit alcohol dehydrogenase family)
MAVNAKGVYLGCKYAVAQMLTQEPVGGSRGRIVNIASIGGLAGLRNERWATGTTLAVDGGFTAP